MYIKQVRTFINVHVVCFCDGTFHAEELKSIMPLNKNIVTFFVHTRLLFKDSRVTESKP
jgi:hypothetical protein